MKQFLVGFVAIIAFLTSFSTSAQSEDTSQYIAPDNSFSFEYFERDNFLIDSTSYQAVVLMGNSLDGEMMIIRVFNPRAINVFLLDRLGEIPTELEDIADSINSLLGFYCIFTEPWEVGEIDVILSSCGEHQSHYFFALEGDNWGFVSASEGAYEESVHQIIQTMHANAEMDLTEYITLSMDDISSEALMEQLRDWNIVTTQGQLVYENYFPRVQSDRTFMLTDNVSIQDFVIAAEIDRSFHGECGLYGRVDTIRTHIQDSLSLILYPALRLSYIDTYGTYMNSGHWNVDYYTEGTSHHYVVVGKGNQLMVFIDGWPFIMDGLVTTNAGDLALHTLDTETCSFSNVWAYSLDNVTNSSGDVN